MGGVLQTIGLCSIVIFIGFIIKKVNEYFYDKSLEREIKDNRFNGDDDDDW